MKVSTKFARSRANAEQARDWLDALTASPPSVTVDLAEACGSYLQHDIAAQRDLPPESIAVEDGYAVQARASAGASDYNPLPLRLRTGPGGHPLQPNEAKAVISGARLPAGADTVVTLDEAELRGGVLELYHAVPEGQHVVRAGEEAAQNQVLFSAGHQLRPIDLALLAQLRITRVAVARPRVRLLLIAPPEHDSNGLMLQALLNRDGAASVTRGYAKDRAVLESALSEADADLILICGGSGDGENDFSAAALAGVGELAFHGLAMNPGETTAIGRVGEVPVVLLPGAPLACFYAYEWFAGRALRRLTGGSGEWPYGLRRTRLARKVASSLGRLEFCRVQLRDRQAHPLAIAERRLLSSAVRADGFVPVPSSSEGWPEGTEVTVWMQNPSPCQE